jgi:hypothetical protein
LFSAISKEKCQFSVMAHCERVSGKEDGAEKENEWLVWKKEEGEVEK